MEILLSLQRSFNNLFSIENSILNKIVYNFIFVQALNLIKSFATFVVEASNFRIETFDFTIGTRKSFADDALTLKQRRLIVRIEVSNAIAFAQINAKYYYDSKH